MEDSVRRGFMAAIAVSGGVVFLAVHAHNRLLSDFINKIEFQTKTSTGRSKDGVRKKVRFAESKDEKYYVKKERREATCRNNGEILEGMPQNRQVLYKGIMQNRNRMF
ncbi:hypothetical protein SASPL_102087 [Salvia splendens]|uniref:Uncharacterized protein n=1 Tax=Salvia splendens TaxID=180675 RepID=A0A8X8YVP5_SALSN|nr:hypothetical protein SASPL_102087 [Salvia splendens]